MDYFQLEFVQIYHNELTIIVILYLLTTLAILDAKIAFVEWGRRGLSMSTLVSGVFHISDRMWSYSKMQTIEKN